jgi:hypothetical protein
MPITMLESRQDPRIYDQGDYCHAPGCWVMSTGTFCEPCLLKLPGDIHATIFNIAATAETLLAARAAGVAWIREKSMVEEE